MYSSALDSFGLSSTTGCLTSSTGFLATDATSTSSTSKEELTTTPTTASSSLFGSTDNSTSSWYEPSSKVSVYSDDTTSPTIAHPRRNVYTFREGDLIRKMCTLVDDLAKGNVSLERLTAAVFGSVSNKQRSGTWCQRGLEVYALVGIALDLLSKGQFAYQRDIFYRNKTLFKSTDNVRLLCSKLALYLGVSPAQLNILSCPKGRMYGNLSLELVDGSVVDYSSPSAQTIPHARFVHRIRQHCSVRQTLVVEKETALFALIQSGFGQRFPWIVLVTGKGYPDVNTREVLGMFANEMPVSVLVDYDPDGAQIYRVYAEGGVKNDAHTLPHARWAGLHCSYGRIGRWGLDPEAMIEFTGRDRRLALHLIKGWERSVELRREMAKMLYRGKKVELEAITQFRGMLLDYVDFVICER